MRTLKLTHEQIEVICFALGIAEEQFAQLSQKVFKDFTHVRGNFKKSDFKETALKFYDQSTIFADLNQDIQNNNLDV